MSRSISSIVGKVLTKYRTLLAKRPFLTQVIQTGCIMASGDFVAQKFVEKKHLVDVDLQRTKNFFLVGSCVVGPTLTVWYKVLNTYVGSAGKSVAVKKMFLDQLLFAPIFSLVILIAIGFVDGQSFKTIKEDLSDHYVDIMKANYCLWPMVQMINFYIMPLAYQVLFVQLVAVFWNTFVSWRIALTKTKNQ